MRDVSGTFSGPPSRTASTVLGNDVSITISFLVDRGRATAVRLREGARGIFRVTLTVLSHFPCSGKRRPFSERKLFTGYALNIYTMEFLTLFSAGRSPAAAQAHPQLGDPRCSHGGHDERPADGGEQQRDGQGYLQVRAKERDRHRVRVLDDEDKHHDEDDGTRD